VAIGCLTFGGSAELSRRSSVATSLTVLLSILPLALTGGEVLRSFTLVINEHPIDWSQSEYDWTLAAPKISPLR
jgi:hypothetical protein